MTAEFRPRLSRVALAVLWVAVAASLAALADGGLPALPALAAGAAVLAVGVRESRRLARLPLLGLDDTGWYLDDGTGFIRGSLRWRRSLLPGFLALRFERVNGGSRSLVLFADTLGRDQWRRLRMLLQCSGG